LYGQRIQLREVTDSGRSGYQADRPFIRLTVAVKLR
jgi:hypothetical protein